LGYMFINFTIGYATLQLYYSARVRLEGVRLP
jgi:hypothetical protein